MVLVCKKFIVSFLLLSIINTTVFATTVGVYTGRGSSGSKGIIDTLKDKKGLSVKTFKTITPATLKGVDVLIISHAYRTKKIPVIRQFVKNGGGVLFTHDSAGSDRNSGEFLGISPFPELVKTAGHGEGYVTRNNVIKVVKKHPITRGLVGKDLKSLLQRGTFKHTYGDHATLLPVDDRFVLLEDVQAQDKFSQKRFGGTQMRWDRFLGGGAVLVAGGYGKGRVVLCGILFGLSSKDFETKVTGADRKLLMNCIKWLAGKTPFGLPEEIEKTEPSKYTRPTAATYPEYVADSIKVLTNVNGAIETAQAYEVECTLPDSTPLGKSVPVVIPAMDIPAGGYQAVLLDKAGKAVEQFPAQVEKSNGKKRLVFVGTFSQRKNRVQIAPAAKASISVEVTSDGRLAEISGPNFQMLLAVENGQPTIQSLNMKNQGWFRSWQGLERNDMTSPVLRLSNSEWPFLAKNPRVDHEKGLPMPSLAGLLTSVHRYPSHVKLKIGSGKIDVYNTGQMKLEGFGNSGRIATIAFDGYLQKNKWIEEAVSYDLPVLKDGWVWAIRRDNFAVGGDFDVTDKMGETGLAPGMERQIDFVGETLVATTADKLGALQVKLEPVRVDGKITPINKVAKLRTDDAKKVLPARSVRVHKLLKMRGKNGFYDILPQPVEIYQNEWAIKTPAIRKWKISDPSVALISFSNKGKFKTELIEVKPGDATTVIYEDMVFDPNKEDWDVVRRFFLKPPANAKLPISKDIAIIGVGVDGKEKLRIPVRYEAAVTLPIGIYTYTNNWHYRGTEVNSLYWPRMMRDIAVNNMDFIIHKADMKKVHQYDSAYRIAQRLKRYGLWWVPNVDHLWAAQWLKPIVVESTADDFIIRNLPELQRRFAKVSKMLKGNNNILAWHLSEEVPQKKPGHPLFKKSFGLVDTIYTTWKKYGDDSRPAFNLISEYFTPIKYCFKYLKSDIFVWDPYHTGAAHALAEGEKVNKGWRQPKGKPAWITLRSCGPNFCDTMDLWLDIRRRSIAAFQGQVDGLNYYEYAHWASNMEQFTYYAVIPGPKGPVATPRWQALGEVTRDIQLLTTAERLLEQYKGTDKSKLVKKFDQAVQKGSNGEFYKMRSSLRKMIKRLRQKG